MNVLRSRIPVDLLSLSIRDGVTCVHIGIGRDIHGIAEKLTPSLVSK